MTNPKDIQLDSDEQEIEDNFEQLPAYPAEVKTKKMMLHQAAASHYLKKDKRITLQVSSSDLERLKQLSAEAGLTYQTYITSLLHKISIGQLKDNFV